MFGVNAGRGLMGGGRSRIARACLPAVRAALLLVAALAVAPAVRAQTLDEWIVRFGEAAAQQSAAQPPAAQPPAAQPGAAGRTGAVGAGTPASPAIASAPERGAGRAAPPRACGAALASGELVLRGGATDECGLQQLTTAVRDAAQAMNERRPGREPVRDAARDPGCGSEEACRRNLRTERLKEVSALKHEEAQMARTPNAPRNVTIPPAKKAGGNWTWQTYSMGR